MSILRIHPNLIEPVNANDGDVLIYNAANGVIQLGTVPSDLEGSANDFSTYTTLTSDYSANDYATYSTLLGNIDTVQANLTSVIGAAPSALDTLAEIAAALENDANIAVTLITAIDAVQSNVSALPDSAANDYATYTTLQSELSANDYNTLLSAQSNDGVTLLSAHSNDFTTYTTITSDYSANDYATYTTLTSDYSANDYNTYSILNANIANVSSLISISGIDVQITDANLVPSANNIYSLGSPDRVWKDLYLSGNSLVIGNTVISESTGGGITISAEGGTTSLAPETGNVNEAIATAMAKAQEAIELSIIFS